MLNKGGHMHRNEARALRQALWFLVAGVLWIAVTDHLVLMLVDDIERMHSWQNKKGWVFVGLVALLGWWLILRSIRREQKLHASVELNEARLRALFDQVPDAMVLLDHTAGTLSQPNDRFQDLFGSQAKADAPLTLDALLKCCDRDQARYFRQQLAALGHDATLAFEMEFRGPAARPTELFEVRLRRVDLRDTADVLIMLRSIEAQRRDRERLLQAQAVFESMRDGVVVTNTERAILAVNPSFCRITGYQESEVLGKNPSILQSGAQDKDFYRELWQQIAEAGHWSGELWNRRKNGEYYPERLSISMVRDDNGKPLRYVAVFTDMSDIYQSRRKLEQATFYDSLTGLPNRALLQRELSELVRHGSAGQPITLMLLDLDDFRRVNDSLGYPAGDTLLCELGRRLKRGLEGGQRLARLDGDEFALAIQGGLDQQAIGEIAARLIDASQQPYQLDADHTVYVRASVGVSRYPQDAEDVERLFQHADTALSEAKHLGKNTWCIYDADMKARAAHWLSTEARLREALENDEFQLHYQPLVHGCNHPRVVGVEALLRWQPADGPMVPPDEFIGIAESTGVIVPLGRWVLEHACRQVLEWQKTWPELSLAVNVSGRQLESDGFTSMLSEVLERSGFDPAKLELELTESVLLADVLNTRCRLDQVKALGVRLAVDDFGTGYSSLAYLQRLPIDKLKIDRSFVNGIGSESGDRAIAETIVAMANTLGLEVLAEGVETQGQCQALADMGCLLFQGYLFSRPLPVSRLSEYLGAARAGGGAS